jgi:hypothetical protein
MEANRDAPNAKNTRAGENQPKMRNSQLINQIWISESHSQKNVRQTSMKIASLAFCLLDGSGGIVAKRSAPQKTA